MTIRTLQRIDKSRNMARFYELSVQPTLFGDVSVARHWGRIGTGGQSREYWFATEGDAQAMAARILQQKEHRGYIAVG